MPQLTQVSSPIGNLIGAANRGITPILDEYFQKRKQQRNLDEFFGSEAGKPFEKHRGIIEGMQKGILPKEWGLQALKQEQEGQEAAKLQAYLKTYNPEATLDQQAEWIAAYPGSDASRNTLSKFILPKYSDQIEGEKTKAKGKAEKELKDTEIKENLGKFDKYIEGLSPEERPNNLELQTMRAAIEGNIPTAALNQLMKRGDFQRKIQEVNDLFPGIFGASQDRGGMSTTLGEQPTSTGEQFPDISPKAQLAASLVSPSLGSTLSSIKSQNVAEKKQLQNQRQFEHTQTKDFADELRNKSDNAVEIKNAIVEARKALKKGASGANARNLAFKYLQAKKNPLANIFQTEDTQSLINSAKTLAGGFRNLFGSKPTQAEFFWYENILPDLLKSAEVNESTLKYFEKVADYNLKQQEIADELVKANKGYRNIDLDAQVREKMKNERNNLISEGFKISGSETVRIKAPNGDIKDIPKNKVQAALDAGGELI